MQKGQNEDEDQEEEQPLEVEEPCVDEEAQASELGDAAGAEGSESEDQEPEIQESSKGNDNEINTNDTENISEEPVTLLKTETIFDLDEDIIARHLNTIQNIKSKTLHQEFLFTSVMTKTYRGA